MVLNSCFGFLGDVEEAYENSKKIAENPHLDILKVCWPSFFLSVFLAVEGLKIAKFWKIQAGIILSIYGLQCHPTKFSTQLVSKDL